MTKTPWHLWLVGVLSLLWNGFGATDFTMTTVARDAWFAMMGMTTEQITQFEALPSWMWAAWALGVYGGLVGSVLLLVRRRLAVAAFAVSLLGAAGGLLYQAVLAPPGGPGAMMPAIITVIAAFLFWYAGAMAKRGVLR